MNESRKGPSFRQGFHFQVASLPTHCRGHSFWSTIVAVVMGWRATNRLVTGARSLLYYVIGPQGWDGATGTMTGGVEHKDPYQRHCAWSKCPQDDLISAFFVVRISSNIRWS